MDSSGKKLVRLAMLKGGILQCSDMLLPLKAECWAQFAPSVGRLQVEAIESIQSKLYHALDIFHRGSMEEIFDYLDQADKLIYACPYAEVRDSPATVAIRELLHYRSMFKEGV